MFPAAGPVSASLWVYCDALSALLVPPSCQPCPLCSLPSMNGHSVVPQSVVHFYSATKYAVTALTEGLRQELREAKTHIRATVSAEGPLLPSAPAGGTFRGSELFPLGKSQGDAKMVLSTLGMVKKSCGKPWLSLPGRLGHRAVSGKGFFGCTKWADVCWGGSHQQGEALSWALCSQSELFLVFLCFSVPLGCEQGSTHQRYLPQQSLRQSLLTSTIPLKNEWERRIT